eukprot:TRINITY_DN1320_c0_g1_i1.p1 TRINITY_DN1320_c0_g1~~TRINITY_DN1320_c0_g1_i1.p1  ORF type:complete len:602 (-),score=123.89 TRINITY_DN1320_c0_g1_i1:59-1753(-)
MAICKKIAVTTACLILVCCTILQPCTALTSGVGVHGTGARRSVTTAAVEKSLQDSLKLFLNGGSSAAAKQLKAVEGSTWQTYQSLPKNQFGRLGPKGVRYLVHNYFAKEHGWLIKGLEPHGNQDNTSEVHEVNILQDKAPALVESLLEHQRGDRGLSHDDTVVMMAALERLIFDESVTLLQASYDLNEVSPQESLKEEHIHEVLTSYLMLFEMGERADLSDPKAHQSLKRRAAQRGGSWSTLVEFERNAVSNYARGDRTKQSFSFQEATEITESLASGYGKWQNAECKLMKEDLMSMVPDGTGRVPLRSFYSRPEGAEYHFTESEDYLRQIGALDETTAGSPSVRIANYLAGPSNCIASSSYYSVCCISECEGLMNELEAKVLAPSASPQRLLDLVSNMSSSTVDSHRRLSADMTTKLHGIAEYHDGEVPLHGRLFAQWMHHAFPNECPFPEVLKTAATLTPGHWENKETIAAKEKRKEVAEAAVSASSSEAATLPWIDHELLHAHEPKQQTRSFFGSMLRFVVQLAMLGGLFSVALSNWSTATAGANFNKFKGKEKVEYDLPF